MDQLKDFLKQCVKYRFWIACGVSLLLPIIAYFIGFSTISAETTKIEAEIKGADAEVRKYSTPGLVNNQYKPLADTKKEVLTQDVDATWRKLFATQEPLLKWPVEVEEKFRKWGRKFPTDVDRSQVQSTIIDYTVAYPEFVNRIYKIFNPFNFDDGSGIVVAPEANALLAPAPFSQDSPPELGKIWAEQERIWVVTALLDVIAKVNDGVGAKDWDGAVIKQINQLEVGSPADQDQKSIAKGETLEAAVTLSPDGTIVAAAAAPAPAGGEMGGGGGAMGGKFMGGMPSGGGGATRSDEVFYLKTDSLQFKSLPVKMTVLVDQARLPNFLVGLENSPMAIQVLEVEIAKPLTPVAKPAYGERSSFSMGGGGMMGMGRAMMGGRGEDMMPGGGGNNASSRNMGRGMSGPAGGGNGRAGGGSSSLEEMMGGNRGRSGVGTGAAAGKSKQGVDNRSVNAAEERKKAEKKEKDAAKARAEAKKIDQYFNVIEVTVYGQARFYLAPPSPAEALPSTATGSPAPPTEAPKPEPVTPPKTEDAPKPAAAPAPSEDSSPGGAPKPPQASKP